jgi:hypothetical protein
MQDDNVQYNNPEFRGGANSDSLRDHQRTWLLSSGLADTLETKIGGRTFVRAAGWRPLPSPENVGAGEMQDLHGYVEHYVAKLSGPHAETAWHSLVEAGPPALPHVVRALDVASDLQVRVRLIQVIAQYRSQEAVPLLTGMLQDRKADIWKAALDGLVMVGGRLALDSLDAAKPTAGPEQREWIDEAIEQIAAGHKPH